METFYSQDYSLRSKHLSTSLYIRHARYKSHCVAAWRPLNEPYPQVYWYEDIERYLATIDWKRTLLIAHHAHFDGLILSHHYGRVPAKYGCTMSMSRAWHGSHSRSDLDSVANHYGFVNKIVDMGNLAKNVGHFTAGGVPRALFGDYGKGDVMNCWLAYQAMIQEGFPQAELDLIDRIIAMFANPCLTVDRPLARSELLRERTERAKLIAEAGEELDDLRSRETFAQMLRDKGVEPPTKIKKNKDGVEYVTYAFAKTDFAFRALEQHPDPEVGALVEAKLAASSTIGESRAQALLDRSLAVFDEDVPAEKRNKSTKTAPMPVYINYAKAHTLRMSGGDGNNPQNFPSKERGGKASKIRATLKAPTGEVLVVVDSAQIEARMNGALAGETWLLNAFRAKRDVYSEQAADIYRKPIDKKKNPNERFVGKVATLGLGYGMSGPKFKYTLALGTMGPPVFIDTEFAASAVAAYRQKNAAIVAQWGKLDTLILTLAYGKGGSISYGPMTFEKGVIHMPNGLRLYYPNLRYETDGQTGRGQWLYDQTDRKVSRLYGAMLCIAEDTMVLTDSGWKEIQYVTDYDLVHDGVEFVEHGGLVNKSVQDCVSVDSVWMTPDHEVLTDEGWKPALEKPRPYRPNLWKVDCAATAWLRREEDALVVQMRMRGECDERWIESDQVIQRRLYAELRVRTPETQNPWTEQAPALRCVPIYDRALLSRNPSSLAELRRPRHPSLSTLEQLREFLGRHESDLPVGSDARAEEQHQRLLTEQLHLGNYARAVPQQAQFVEGGHRNAVGADGHRPVDAVLPTQARQVFDIVNAGPRRRFVVLGEQGPFVVHNCENVVQTLARICVYEQVAHLDYRLVLTSHDEVVFSVPRKQAERCLEESIKAMSTPPIWMPEIPVSAEGAFSVHYDK